MTAISARPRELNPPLFIDAAMVVSTLALVFFGLLMVYSATGILSEEKFGDPLYFVKKQGIAATIGFCCMVLFARVRIQSLWKISPILFLISILLVAITLVPGIGIVAGGARRWIGFGAFRLEPAEFVKVLMVIFVAGYLSRHERTLDRFSDGIIKPLLFAGIVGGLLLMEPDFGSAVVITLVILTMATAAGARLRYIATAGFLLVLVASLLIVLSPYRMQRIVSFLSPWADASGKGYQLIQSLIAVGSGHLTGVGLGSSTQKLFFLPAAHTDFIFAVIAEEFGLVGCIALIGVFLVFLARGVSLASKVAHNTFSFSLAVGLTMLVVIPAFLNLGVVLGLLPTKGLVLPLVGYGGSSLISCLMAVGLLLSLWRSHRKQLI